MTTRTAKKTPAKGRPTPRRPKAAPEEKPLTEADFKVDTGAILLLLGVDPAMVKEGTVRVSFKDGYPVLEYDVIRAIPPRVLAAGLLQGSQAFTTPEPASGEQGEQQD